MKASGNKLDYSIMPFMALNQKVISALTSGDVPDLIFLDAPGRFCRRTPGTTKSPTSPTLCTLQIATDRHRKGRVPPSTTRRRSSAATTCVRSSRVRPVPYLGRPGREGRLQALGRPQYLECTLGLLQADAGEDPARQGHAEDLRPRSRDRNGRAERRQRICSRRS